MSLYTVKLYNKAIVLFAENEDDLQSLLFQLNNTCKKFNV